MSIDRQRISAVSVLHALGHRWNGTEWVSPASAETVTREADTMHGLLMDRAERLAGSLEDSDEEAELSAIADALEAYEAKRWPTGRIEGGKG